MKHLTTIALSGLVWAGCIDLDLQNTAPGGLTESSDSIDSTDPASLGDIVARHSDRGFRLPNNLPIVDESGVFTTVSSAGFIDLNNEFFQDLGTNGRRCVSCHVPTAGWSITPAQLRLVFEFTRGGAVDDGFGLGAVFRTNAGSNSALSGMGRPTRITPRSRSML